MSAPRTIIQQAPAKLNLALSVGPPGVDGMHPIASWMVTVSLFDDLTLTQLDDDRLSRYAILWHEEAKRCSDIDWSIMRDLAVRAHLALERHVGRLLPVQMKLEKRIPVGGGLGGGSSDAAAMLRGMNELFELGLSVNELAEIGAGLGSDVPFLVHCGSAIVEGLGERVERLDVVPALHAVLAFPEATCPTAQVYHRFDETPNAKLCSDAVRQLASSTSLDPSAPFNDLAPAAMHIAPGLVSHMRDLASLAQRPAHISGSGSSLFVICDDALHAEALAAAVEGKLCNLPAVAVRAVVH